jgi:hypothetical protein
MPMPPCISRLLPLTICLGLCACTAFDERVTVSQATIDESFNKIGYTPKDVIDFRTTPRSMKGRTWVERSIRFKDKGDRPLAEITKFFKQDAAYPFEYYMTVGESDSDLQFIRWYEFKLDENYPIYRVEFAQPQRERAKQRALAATATPDATTTPAPPAVQQP